MPGSFKKIAFMTKSFSYFSISLFYDCDFKEIVFAINQIKNKEIKSGKIEVQEGGVIVDKYLNPPSGGASIKNTITYVQKAW